MDKKTIFKKAHNTSIMSDAEKAQRIAATAGFDWNDNAEIIHKIIEEVDECIDTLQLPDNEENITMELGDLLFSCINLARFLDIDPEHALELSTIKFKRRMNAMQHMLDKTNTSFTDIEPDKLEKLWAKAKQTETA
jgi:uncharacterized protein YabN with tetrapyrrole methylase and pyrophosphatase domain